jgi:tetratricopeptide (TPR) repeat protein
LRRDYFEKQDIKEQFAVAESKTLNTILKRRLLLITVASGSDGKEDIKDQVSELSVNIARKLKGFLVVPVDIEKLCTDLTGKGLDPASLDFVRKQKACMNLEDAAVLSSILEQESAEIALVVHLEVTEDKARLKAGLLTSTNSLGDNEQFELDDFKGVGALFNAYLEKWLAQENPVSPSLGLVVVDRAGGGVEVTRVLPGYPAAAASIVPGCIINWVEGTPVMKKYDLTSMLKPGVKLRLGLSCRGSNDKADVEAANSPVEAPIEQDGYLYNLAQLEFADRMAVSPADEAGKNARGIAALNLGNVLMHFGEYAKAAKAYGESQTIFKTGVCAGTALYRLGSVYEKLGQWTDAADSYRKAMILYPAATLGDAEGPMVAPLAKERLKELYNKGLTMEKWWL